MYTKNFEYMKVNLKNRIQLDGPDHLSSIGGMSPCSVD